VLSNCKKITDVGGQKLLEALKDNITLKTLNLKGTSISSKLRRDIQNLLKK
jgi:hypothetical protein|tara:strand:+ start:102 stop:254 length:153 start_codon:yes stop_codon:yes gene_type:complete